MRTIIVSEMVQQTGLSAAGFPDDDIFHEEICSKAERTGFLREGGDCTICFQQFGSIGVVVIQSHIERGWTT